MYMCLFFFRFFPHLGYYWILKRGPCGNQVGPCWLSILNIAVHTCPQINTCDDLDPSIPRTLTVSKRSPLPNTEEQTSFAWWFCKHFTWTMRLSIWLFFFPPNGLWVCVKPVNPKGNQPWVFTGRTGTKAEIPIIWPPDAKGPTNRKDPDAGEDCGQKEKGTTEDDMVRWHHWLNAHEFEQTPRDRRRQRSWACSMQSMESQSQTGLSNWTRTNNCAYYLLLWPGWVTTLKGLRLNGCNYSNSDVELRLGIYRNLQQLCLKKWEKTEKCFDNCAVAWVV